MSKGKYIVIEGQDGTGKDTQAVMLTKYFRNQGKKVVHYAESGTASTDPFTAHIAELNYGSSYNIDHKTRVLLYLVNRYNQWVKLAVPALKNGDIVITSRSWLSTLIYEGYAGGVDKAAITRLHKEIMPERYFAPDEVFILALSEEEHKKRLKSQGKRQLEVFKSMGMNFQKKVNSAYLEVAKEQGIPIFDASGTLDDVHERILKQILK